MSVTDQDVLNEIQGHLLEPQNSGASWLSGWWSTAEVISYLNQRQWKFLKDTCILLKRADLVTTPNVTRQPLPTDCILVDRIYWRDALGRYREIPKGDSWDADQHLSTWEIEFGNRPLEFSSAEVPQLQIQIAPASSEVGVLEALYVYLSTALSNSGISLTVPDELSPAIKWGVIADMLSKVGRGQDLVRAKYAEQRYEEGVAAAQIMLGGGV